MKETLVTFEIAAMLKEAGFDVPTSNYFSDKVACELSSPDNFNRDTWAPGYCSRPDVNTVCDWLYDARGMHIAVSPSGSKWGYIIYTQINSMTWDDKNWGVHSSRSTARTAAIKKALLILKNRK